MSDAPERIWVDNWRNSGEGLIGICGERRHVGGGVEYIRADRCITLDQANAMVGAALREAARHINTQAAILSHGVENPDMALAYMADLAEEVLAINPTATAALEPIAPPDVAQAAWDISDAILKAAGSGSVQFFMPSTQARILLVAETTLRALLPEGGGA